MSNGAVNRPDSNDLAAPVGHEMLAALIALAGAVAFGALDQSIGSRSELGTAVSGMSALWLLMPFAIGAFQPRWRRAAWLGLASTWLAVGAYVLMIDSPMEGVHPTLHVVALSAVSQWPWFLGGTVIGPLYGVLGYHWRLNRSMVSATLAAAPLLLEPLCGRFGLRPEQYPPASYAEVLAGVALVVFFAVAVVLRLRERVQR
jgi:Family of unknown function (DUF6518)